MEKDTRNLLRNTVVACRELLLKALADMLQGQFGIHQATGLIEPVSAMGHLSAEDKQYRADIVAHLEHIQAGGLRATDAIAQLVREVAFTHLNRLAAFKLMEQRGLIKESVSRGLQSRNFIIYRAAHDAEEAAYNAGQTELVYRNFLLWLAQTYAAEVTVLFSPHDPANRLFPAQHTLNNLLELLNDPKLQPVWAVDETVGWIYQYFTPKELRDKAREESAAPRNSYELSFRNQFYTPRYVVEFLVDNTLGRIWYEMRQGQTTLADQCRYLVRRPNELWLAEPSPAANVKNSAEPAQTEAAAIQFRKAKDPRELKIIDPACGSGHFLLYCFDLLEIIYREAYADPAPIFNPLRQDYPDLAALERDLPRLILLHNLHGIDIDLRACQIAAIALWLRAQRTYKQLNLPAAARPQIRRANIVCAEPMPGEQGLLDEFVADLQPPALGEMVNHIFKRMQLAGEAGSLLKIEQEVSRAIDEAKERWTTVKPVEAEQLNFDTIIKEQENSPAPAQLAQRDPATLPSEEFWQQAEDKTLAALQTYANQAQTGQSLTRRLFAEDTERGFAFIDLCRQSYDVVLMNPPFGESTKALDNYFTDSYPTWNGNILCAFIERACEKVSVGGAVGVIYDRTAIVKSTYELFRKSTLVPDNRLVAVADLGWNVLDANVEVTTSVIYPATTCTKGIFIDVRDIDSGKKGEELNHLIKKFHLGVTNPQTYLETSSSFKNLPNAVIGYDFPQFLKSAFNTNLSLEDSGFKAYQGHALKADKHFRLWWEVSLGDSAKFLARMFNGTGFSPFSTTLYDCVIAKTKLEQLPKDTATVLRNKTVQMLPGICFGKRGDYFCVHVLPSEHIFTVEGQAIPIADSNLAFELLGMLNTPLVRFSLNKYCGQHKYSGYVNLFPYSPFPHVDETRSYVKHTLQTQNTAQSFDELQSLFSIRPYGNSIEDYSITLKQTIDAALEATITCETFCHTESLTAYNVTNAEKDLLEKFRSSQPKPALPIEDADMKASCKWLAAHSLVSHAAGYLFGRWDIRLATGQRAIPALPDPFAPLPACSPGMLTGGDGLPLAQPPAGYPLALADDGILVDDARHSADIVKRVRDVLTVLWGEQADAIEQEACKMLGVKSLRDYLRNSSKGGFWLDHVGRYSKSRRKAPIYWLLQSAKRNYGLWLYYHKLDKNMLFSALQRYVEPKLRQEQSELEKLRSNQQTAGGDGGKTLKQLEKEIEKQLDLVSEVQDFHDKLKRVADLYLEPDLNDGVILNIAPLRELVAWPEAKKYWTELTQGKYEWSSVGQQLRQKGYVK